MARRGRLIVHYTETIIIKKKTHTTITKNVYYKITQIDVIVIAEEISSYIIIQSHPFIKQTNKHPTHARPK